jgi:hypothetical protein
MLDEVAGNTTWCLGRGTRRRVIVREGSGVGRKLLGAVVWYAQGVRIVGCILQPRTAVRRLGAVHSMVGLVLVMVVLKKSWWSLEVNSLKY